MHQISRAGEADRSGALFNPGENGVSLVLGSDIYTTLAGPI